jgi:hypothetical protein
MTTAGDNITVANITATARTLAGYNVGIVWHAGNNPFQNTAIPLAGGNATGYPTLYGDPITDTNITASTLTTNFRAYATQLSRIRNTRLLKWYQIQGDVRASLSSDESNITNLNSDYQYDFIANATGTAPAVGSVISASALDAFVNELVTVISNQRSTVVTVEEFYCHSNCHGSCHGSI